MYDGPDIFALIDSVVEDGELSSEEAIAIAAWLDSHPGARRKWPGNAIFEALADVMPTDKITKPELRKLGKLLMGIPHERANRENSNVVKATRDLVDSSLMAFNPGCPAVPSIGIVAEIASETYSGVKYEVDLTYPSCTCPDGQSRAQLSVGSLNRCCKHVFRVYSQVRPRQGWPQWLDAVFANARPPTGETHWLVIRTAPVTLVGISDREWCDVFAPRRTIYERFGYSRVEGRWAYGDRPKNADYLEAEIASFLRAWGKTAEGKANVVRTRLAVVAREKRIVNAIASRRQFLATLCGDDYATALLPPGGDESHLLTRVLRPINDAISQTFKANRLSDTDRLSLQIAIAHASYLKSLLSGYYHLNISCLPASASLAAGSQFLSSSWRGT